MTVPWRLARRLAHWEAALQGLLPPRPALPPVVRPGAAGRATLCISESTDSLSCRVSGPGSQVQPVSSGAGLGVARRPTAGAEGTCLWQPSLAFSGWPGSLSWFCGSLSWFCGSPSWFCGSQLVLWRWQAVLEVVTWVIIWLTELMVIYVLSGGPLNTVPLPSLCLFLEKALTPRTERNWAASAPTCVGKVQCWEESNGCLLHP